MVGNYACRALKTAILLLLFTFIAASDPAKAVFLVATPIGVKPILNYERDSSFSGFDFDWNNINKKAKHFLVFQSDDDPYVCLGNGEHLAKNLNVALNFVPNAGHFNKRAGYTKFDLLLEKLKPIL